MENSGHDQHGQQAELPQQVADLVGEVSETPSQSRARNVAAAISRIAGRSGEAGWHAVTAAGETGWRAVTSAGDSGRSRRDSERAGPPASSATLQAEADGADAGNGAAGADGQPQGPGSWHRLVDGGRRAVQAGGRRAAGSSGQAWRAVVSGGDASRRAVVSGTEAGWRAVVSSGQAGRRAIAPDTEPGTDVSREAAAPGRSAGWSGLRSGGEAGWHGIQFAGRWLSGQVLAMAPRLPVRDLERLRAQHPGLNREELADALINNAARSAGLVGMATGGAMILPLPNAPVEVVVETLVVVGIEFKLVAELHEVYGERAPGSVAERMLAYAGAWAQRRGISFAPAGLILVAGSPLRRRLQRRLIARAGRSVLSLGPLLTGAVAGAALNQRETRNLGAEVRKDLRSRLPQNSADWPD